MGSFRNYDATGQDRGKDQCGTPHSKVLVYTHESFLLLFQNTWFARPQDYLW
jgi:hypothetical protein